MDIQKHTTSIQKLVINPLFGLKGPRTQKSVFPLKTTIDLYDPMIPILSLFYSTCEKENKAKPYLSNHEVLNKIIHSLGAAK